MKYTYNKKDLESKVLVTDGDKEIEIILSPMGAGTEIDISKDVRRGKFLEKKIESMEETAETAEDFDKIQKDIDALEKIEQSVEDVTRSFFKAETEDGKKWIEDRTYTELLLVLDQVGEQRKANG